MVWLSDAITFPNVNLADQDGLLAIGGDLSLERLCLAYQKGIFPWYDEPPILWWSPNPRMVLFPNELRVSKSMKKLLRDQPFDVSYNSDFENVIQHCSKVPRSGQNGSWLNSEMIDAYCQLHNMGIAHSVEVWQNTTLVGGLYGVQIGNIFCGESMFSLVSNASKYGFISFIKDHSSLKLIDCQVYSDHLASLGAREITRNEFIRFLNHNLF